MEIVKIAPVSLGCGYKNLIIAQQAAQICMICLCVTLYILFGITSSILRENPGNFTAFLCYTVHISLAHVYDVVSLCYVAAYIIITLKEPGTLIEILRGLGESLSASYLW